MNLVERLRDTYENWGLGSKGPGILTEAADAIERLQQELETARESLEPFAKLGGAYVKYGPSDNSPFADAPNDIIIQVGATYQRGWTVTVGELRAAATSFYCGTP